MPDAPARSILSAAAIPLICMALAGTARAELPAPADFTVEYFVTDQTGAHVRAMSDIDRSRFLNRARCECGQQVGIELQMTNAPADPTAQLDAFIGTQCSTAETSMAGNRRCGQLASALIPAFEMGITAAFHPAFLFSGVDPSSPSRDIADPETRLAGGCRSPSVGESGLWMCKPGENGIADCQQEEFFLGSTDSDIPTLRFDLQPPLLEAGDLSVTPGDGEVELRWNVPSSGDIEGYRVLCEEVDGGASPALAFTTPELTAEYDGRHYFTAGNLCGDKPFFDVTVSAPEISDPNTCGNGVVEPGETCDDGHDNHDDGLCDPGCALRVSPSLHALDWDHVCSDHISFSQRSVVIAGLDNGTAYNFVLVPYDYMGNPKAHARVVTATPDGAAAGFGCGCTTGPNGHGLFTMLFGTVSLLGLRRRRNGANPTG